MLFFKIFFSPCIKKKKKQNGVSASDSANKTSKWVMVVLLNFGSYLIRFNPVFEVARWLDLVPSPNQRPQNANLISKRFSLPRKLSNMLTI